MIKMSVFAIIRRVEHPQSGGDVRHIENTTATGYGVGFGRSGACAFLSAIVAHVQCV